MSQRESGGTSCGKRRRMQGFGARPVLTHSADVTHTMGLPHAPRVSDGSTHCMLCLYNSHLPPADTVTLIIWPFSPSHETRVFLSRC